MGDEEFHLDTKYVNDTLYKRLSAAQNEIIQLESLVSQLLDEKKRLEHPLDQGEDPIESERLER